MEPNTSLVLLILLQYYSFMLLELELYNLSCWLIFYIRFWLLIIVT